MAAREPRQARIDQDPCVVPTAALAPIVRDFCDDWRKERPCTRNQFGSDERGQSVDVLTPYESLSQETGLPEETIKKLRNPKRHPLTELRVADRFLLAVDRQDLLDSGSVSVYGPGGCCGGSAANPYVAGFESFALASLTGSIVRQ